jgi:hypothetical protein
LFTLSIQPASKVGGRAHYRRPRVAYFQDPERWSQNVADLLEVLAILKAHITRGDVPQDYRALLDAFIQRYLCSIFYYKPPGVEVSPGLILEKTGAFIAVPESWPGRSLFGRVGSALERFWRDLRMASGGHEYYIMLRRYLAALIRNRELPENS